MIKLGTRARCSAELKRITKRLAAIDAEQRALYDRRLEVMRAARTLEVEPMTQQAIADDCGISREAVNKLLGEKAAKLTGTK